MATYTPEDVIRYVEGELSSEEKQKMEEDVRADASLAARVDLYRQLKGTLEQRLPGGSEEEALRQTLGRMGGRYFGGAAGGGPGHPRTGQVVGNLCAAQWGQCSGGIVVADGPQPLYAQQTNNLITITFPAATRLKINGNKSLTGFELVNNKGERLPAGAGIFNNTIRLIVPSGEEIKMIYYAMQPYTRANLINTDGLPASTFIMVKKGDKFY